MASGGVVEGPGRLIVPADGGQPYWDSPEYAARLTAAREDLSTSGEAHLALRRMAKAGDTTAAWALVCMLADTLRAELETPASTVAAEFFERLELLYERRARACKSVKTETLAPALVMLGIAKSRGRPPKEGGRTSTEAPAGLGWGLVQELASDFGRRTPLHRWAASFFRRLLHLRSHPATGALDHAFRRLHLVQRPCPPRRNDDTQLAAMLADEELERSRGVSAKMARAAQAARPDSPIHDASMIKARTKAKALANIVSPNSRGSSRKKSLLTTAELLALSRRGK